MSKVQIRKTVATVETIHQESGVPVEKPIRRCTVAAVIKNPLAGKPYQEDLSELMDIGEELGTILGKIGLETLGTEVVSYGKGAIVGTHGEAEHSAAILHTKLGKSLRAVIGGNCKALIASNEKVGPAGAPLDIPVGHRVAAAVRSHYDTIPGVTIWDAPREDEIVVYIALCDGGRPHPRVGGWRVDQIIGEDGNY